MGPVGRIQTFFLVDPNLDPSVLMGPDPDLLDRAWPWHSDHFTFLKFKNLLICLKVK